MIKTAEHLGRSVRREDIPSQALGAFDSYNILEANGGSPFGLMTTLKGALYPGWDRYSNRQPQLPANLQPLYRIECDTPRQIHLAQLLRPEIGDVQIVLRETPHEGRSEITTPAIATSPKHPFLEKIGNFFRKYDAEVALLSFSSVVYGGVVLSPSLIIGSMARSMLYGAASPSNEPYIQTAVGVGLIAAGTFTSALAALSKISRRGNA